MSYDKAKYHIDLEGMLSNLERKIPKGYIEVKRATKYTKKDSSNEKTKQIRQ